MSSDQTFYPERSISTTGIFTQSPQSDHSREYMIAVISSTFNVIAKLYLVQLINCDHENRSQCCFKANLSFHKIVFKA
jgi:hypothetical protein